MLNNNKIADAFCDAVETLVDRKFEQAQFDKTIEATISQVLDVFNGIYEVKYQDATFTVYTDNTVAKYVPGDRVYILVPKGDMRKQKTIIGLTTKDTTKYITNVSGERVYNITGMNCFTGDYVFNGCSYQSSFAAIPIDNINLDDFAYYLAHSTHLMLAARFTTTAIPKEQKARGNFGLKLTLEFADGDKTFILDTSDLNGGPYHQNNQRQYEIYDVTGQEFIRIKSLHAFVKDFPHNDSTKPLDIRIEDIELTCLTKLSSEQLNGAFLRIVTPMGTIFNSTKQKLLLEPELMISGEILDKNSYLIKWFEKDASMTLTSEDFNSEAGQGWRYIGNSSTLELQQDDYPVAETTLRGIASYNNGSVIENTVVINNTAGAEYQIVINSDSLIFSNNDGVINLECRVQKKVEGQNQWINIPEAEIQNYKYTWQKTPVGGISSVIGSANSHIISIAADDVVLNTVYSCAVQRVQTNGLKYIGTAQVVLSHKWDATIENPNFTLKLINSEIVYKYDHYGISPTHESQETPIQIQPLSFELMKNDGAGIEPEDTETYWGIPKENSLLKSVIPVYDCVLEDDEYYYFKGCTFEYAIADEFDIAATNNNITVLVNYMGEKIGARTNFVFTKDGLPGTNGTNIVCKTSVVDINGQAVVNPMVTKLDNSEKYKYNFINGVVGNAINIKTQLWQNSSLIGSGYTTQHSVAQLKDDNTFLTVNHSNPIIALTIDFTKENIANILKSEVKFDNKTYYAHLPLITAQQSTDEYTIRLKEHTGFQYVMYSASGYNPTYNKRPFEIEIIGDLSNATPKFEWAASDYYTLKDLGDGRAEITPVSYFIGDSLTIAAQCKVTINTFEAIIHIPIHYYLNRFGNEAINGWDGNSIDLGDENGTTILAPQVGAGHKDNNNRFTGVLMGTQKAIGENNTNVTGLFGYNQGRQTMFLNAEDGSAHFGSGKASIDMVPNEDRAVIQGGYDQATDTYAMTINLTKPSIEYGNGNFKVDEKGMLTAQGADIGGKISAENGHIGGWAIGEDRLKNSTNTVSLFSNHQNNLSIAAGQGSYIDFGWDYPSIDAEVLAWNEAEINDVSQQKAFAKLCTELTIQELIGAQLITRDPDQSLNDIYITEAQIDDQENYWVYYESKGYPCIIGVSGAQIGKIITLESKDMSLKVTFMSSGIWVFNPAINNEYLSKMDSFVACMKIAPYPFEVYNTGEMRATSGQIGGFTMNATSLLASREGNKHEAGFYSKEHNGLRIFAGLNNEVHQENHNPSHPFEVYSDGCMYATRGAIGKWKLTQTSLQTLSSTKTEQLTIAYENTEQSGVYKSLDLNDSDTGVKQNGTVSWNIIAGSDRSWAIVPLPVDWNSLLYTSSNTVEFYLLKSYSMSTTTAYEGVFVGSILLQNATNGHASRVELGDKNREANFLLIFSDKPASSTHLQLQVEKQYVFGFFADEDIAIPSLISGSTQLIFSNHLSQPQFGSFLLGSDGSLYTPAIQTRKLVFNPIQYPWGVSISEEGLVLYRSDTNYGVKLCAGPSSEGKCGLWIYQVKLTNQSWRQVSDPIVLANGNTDFVQGNYSLFSAS